MDIEQNEYVLNSSESTRISDPDIGSSQCTRISDPDIGSSQLHLFLIKEHEVESQKKSNTGYVQYCTIGTYSMGYQLKFSALSKSV
ncbi:hypothetical protein VNO77_34265 [Canavalia gladiata]|uniref:Uncharacterized protein n=1 Tax=Canavalia gladiata TaxID=3824 RepID=A0AAN9KGE9_CANGL